MGDIWPEVSRIGAEQSYVTVSLALKPECPASEAKCFRVQPEVRPFNLKSDPQVTYLTKKVA